MRLSFVCNADARSGYGHLARCLALAGLSESALGGSRITFQGTFSDDAAQRIRATLPRASIRPERQSRDADVAVIDRLGTPDSLNSHAEDVIDAVAGRADRLIYIASGTEAPALPAGAVCIGYQPGGPPAAPPKLLWGLEFAPVPPGLAAYGRDERDPARALVALGANPDDAPLQTALAALAQLAEIRSIDVLLSPVVAETRLQAAAHQTLQLHRNIPSVGPLLGRAGLVIASFGNLAYEALSLGAPLCLLAQKAFQLDLSQRMADLGLAVNGGLAQELSASAVAEKMRETRALAPELTRRGARAVDGNGLERIARIIAQGATIQ